MISVLYDILLLFVALAALPKLIFERIFRGKYKKNFLAKLGLDMPDPQNKEGDFIFWIHAVSMGETRAAIPLFQRIKKEYPYAKVYLSTTTETGQAEAKKNMPSADGFFFLPFDFSWNAKRLLKRVRPSVLICIESDFWYHILSEAKALGANIFLVNGKISERSFERFKKVPFFTHKIFQLFDLLCVQSERYLNRFAALGVSSERLYVSGNIKLDIPIKEMDMHQKEKWREELGINSKEKVLVVGSTHHPEEEILLQALKPIWESIPNLKVLIVPRHPERFKVVEEKIRKFEISLITYSQRAAKTGKERVILIDAMGLLMQCYQIADLAIVGGSFTDAVGGHNIFEPIQVKTPVLFGPYMHTQMDLVEWILRAKAGRQISAQEIASCIEELLANPSSLESLKQNGAALLLQVQGSMDRTWNQINSIILKRKVEL